MQTYQRYPLQMNHPSYHPGIISDDNAAGRGRDAPPGKPAMFPPIIVNNDDQEAYYEAKGYRGAAAANAEAFVSIQAAPLPPGYKGPQQYPRWETIDGKQILVQDPNAPVDDRTWPMWVVPPGKDGLIVKSPAEYEAVMGAPYAPHAAPEPADDPEANLAAAELEEFRAWKAARDAAKDAETAAEAERAALDAMNAAGGDAVAPARKGRSATR